MFEGYGDQKAVVPAQQPKADDGIISRIRIKVIGVGGGGCNTITRLTRSGIKSAETVAVNTDLKHLEIVESARKVLIGRSITKGLGSGGFPELAQKCAESSRRDLERIIGESELVFVVAGMGGGTGTGAAPVIADIAKQQGAVVVSMVTYPFTLERARLKKAEWGVSELKKVSDTVVVIDNNRLAALAPNLPIDQAFMLADEISARAIRGIADTIMFPSLINLDYADVKSTLGGTGFALISVGEGRGADKVANAVRSTIEHPLLDVDINGAKGALLHISGGPDLTLGEATKIGEGLTETFDEMANVIMGARVVPGMEDALQVMAIMTGITTPFGVGNSKYLQEKEKEKIAMELEDIKF